MNDTRKSMMTPSSGVYPCHHPLPVPLLPNSPPGAASEGKGREARQRLQSSSACPLDHLRENTPRDASTHSPTGTPGCIRKRSSHCLSSDSHPQPMNAIGGLTTRNAASVSLSMPLSFAPVHIDITSHHIIMPSVRTHSILLTIMALRPLRRLCLHLIFSLWSYVLCVSH